MPKTRELGRSGVEVTALGMGCAALGNLYAPVDDAAAEAAVHAALDCGVGYFDTAPYYGYGLSELRVGLALAGADVRISTKVGRCLVPRDGPAREDQGFVGALAYDPVFDYSYDGVLRSFESSLERLGRDRVDVLLIHDPDVRTHGDAQPRVLEQALDGAYRALAELRESGAAGAIGLGVNECEPCVEALERCDLDCFLLAGRYTLLEQSALDVLLPRCVERGVSLVVGGPYNSGILAGDERHYDYALPPPETRAHVARLRRLCDAHGVPLAAAALQFPLRHPAVAAVIPGARSAVEVRQNAAWLSHPVPDALWKDLRAESLIREDALS
jgi:D-threo-aldose 1-dehydrogenase